MGFLEQQPAPKPSESGESSPEKKPSELILRIRQALESKEGADSLRKIGDLLYETYKGDEYSPAIILSSIREVYDENKSTFAPPLTFNNFLKSFGPGMVMLCQQKLAAAGGYNLGKFGAQKNGVDGKLGKMTSKALQRYYKKTRSSKAPKAQESAAPQIPGEQLVPQLPPQAPVSLPKDVPPPVRPVGYLPTVTPEVAPAVYVPPETSGDTEVVPYTPGTQPGTITPNKDLNPRLDAIYAQNRTTLTHQNLPEHYGRSEEEVRRFIILNDPITGGTATFLGRTIDHKGRSGPGLNMIMLPFLKIAEEEIRRQNIHYQPRNKIGGFAYRNMRLNGKMSNVKSHHAYGLAIDMDSDTNDTKDGRGDIPDEVVLALVNAGFAWGGTRNPAFSYLGRDAMHFQLRFDARDPEAQAILRASPIGMKYWKAILPLLPDEYKKGLDRGPNLTA